MSGNGTEPTYRVVGVRKNDQRVVISSHSTADVANKVVKLLKGGDFVDIHLEENFPPKRRKG